MTAQPSENFAVDVVVAGAGDCGTSILVILRKLEAELAAEGVTINPQFIEFVPDETSDPCAAIAQVVDLIEQKDKYERFDCPLPFSATELTQYLTGRLFLLLEGEPILEARRSDGTPLADVLTAPRLVGYLATPPEAYPAYVEAFATHCRSGGTPTVVALEKPLANSLEGLTRIDELVRTRSSESFCAVSVDHYLGKRALELIQEAFSNFRSFRDDIHERTLQIAVEFMENDLKDAKQRPYFLQTGIIKDMMPHALATVRSLLDDPGLIFHVQRWEWGTGIASQETVATPTFFEGEFTVSSVHTPPRSVWIRFMKGPADLAKRKAMKISTGDPSPITIDFATGEVEIGEGHTFTAAWEGEAGWENCLLWLIREQYDRFPDWDAAVRGMETILSIDEQRRAGRAPTPILLAADGTVGSTLDLDWATLRPPNRDCLFMNLNGWLLNTQAFNDIRVELLCRELGVARPTGIDNSHSLTLRELAVRIMTLTGRDDQIVALSRLEAAIYRELLEETRKPAVAKTLIVPGAVELLEAVAERGRLRAEGALPGLRIIVFSNSLKDHVASFLHSAGLSPYVFLATNREFFPGRDAGLKKDLAERLGLGPERFAVLHDKEHHFVRGAKRFLGTRNDMRAVLDLLCRKGVV